MADPQVCWPKIVVVPKAPSQKPYDLEIKVWCWSTGLHWKLKDVLDVVLHPGIRLSRFVKRDLADFNIIHKGLYGVEAIVESWKAAAANDRAPNSDSHQDYAVSTLSLLLMLVWFSQNRHSLAERGRSEDVLKAFLHYFLPAPLCEEVLGLAVPATVLDVDPCSQLGSQGLCSCCAAVQALLDTPTSDQVPGFRLLGDAVLELAGGEHHLCRQSVVFLGALLSETGRRIESSFEVSEWNQDALKTSSVEAVQGRQPRVDNELKAAAVAAVAQGRAHNTQSLMKAIGYGKDARNWERNELVNFWYVCSQTLSKPSTLVLAVDPARFGNPGEEVVITQAQHVSSGLSLWLPPMVRLQHPMCIAAAALCAKIAATGSSDLSLQTRSSQKL